MKPNFFPAPNAILLHRAWSVTARVLLDATDQRSLCAEASMTGTFLANAVKVALGPKRRSVVRVTRSEGRLGRWLLAAVRKAAQPPRC